MSYTEAYLEPNRLLLKSSTVDARQGSKYACELILIDLLRYIYN